MRYAVESATTQDLSKIAHGLCKEFGYDLMILFNLSMECRRFNDRRFEASEQLPSSVGVVSHDVLLLKARKMSLSNASPMTTDSPFPLAP
jgi:hypothetical protein